MSYIPAIEAEISHLKKTMAGLPDSSIKSDMKKKVKKLQHKLNGLRKKDGISKIETYRKIIHKHLKAFEMFFSTYVSKDGTMEGFGDWFKALSMVEIQSIIHNSNKK